MRALMAVVIAGCGSPAAPAPDASLAPSCQAAMAHYYSTGCVFRAAPVTETIPEADMVRLCENINFETRAVCGNDIDRWLRCLDALTPSTTPPDEFECLHCEAEWVAALRCA